MSHLRLRTVLLLLAIGILFAGSLHAVTKRKFSHLSVDNGLSQNSVWSILRDNQGFLWFATDDGLNKYDGYEFHLYTHRLKDSTSISANITTGLIQDKHGAMWIATSNDLNVFDPVTEKFSIFKLEHSTEKEKRVKGITALAEDSTGCIWVGTYSMGLFRISSDRKTVTHFVNNPRDSSSIGASNIRSLIVDKKGIVWIGTYGAGICRYVETSGRFIPYMPGQARKGSLRSGFITAFFEDSKGRFWVGTRLDGMLLFDRTNGECTYINHQVTGPEGGMDSMTVLAIAEDNSGRIIYGTFGGGVRVLHPESGIVEAWKNDIRDPSSISSDYILSLYSDETGCLWIGTSTNGISKYDPEAEHFQTYRNEIPRTTLFTGNDVRSIYKDSLGLIWIGTTKGLNVFDPVTESCEHYRSDGRSTTSMSDDYISSILEDSRGVMWIGTRTGVAQFNRKTKSFTRMSGDVAYPSAMTGAYIRAMLEDKYGIIWFGTSQGLFSYDRKVHEFRKYSHTGADTCGISNDNIRSLFLDRAGTIWAGAYDGGLNRYDRTTGKFKAYLHDPNDPHSISSDLASPFDEDREGNLWIGTRGGGVNKFNPRTEQFTVYSMDDGLTNNTVFAIRIDANERMWITTSRGLSCFYPATNTFRNYSVAAGLQADEFNLNSSFEDADGTLYFGGIFGFNIFHPDSIHDNRFVPPVYITSMSVFNKPVHFDTAMTMKKYIVLPYNENSISFDCVALNYRKSELNQYKYMLEGFDKEWVQSGATRKASYTNLQPGTYVFRVMGSNNDGVWNTAETSVTIVVTPPYWRTWWAYLLYAAAFVSLLAAGIGALQRRQKKALLLEQQTHEAELVRRKNVKLKEANDEILRQQEILKERNDLIEKTNHQLEHQIQEREALLKELQTAMENVKTLGGLIPICASCKKIRDDEGYWNIIESYLAKHSSAQFSHGICPDCAQKLYPKYAGKPGSPPPEKA